MDYVLVLKKNHKCPYYEVDEYFKDADFLKKIRETKQTEDKAHGRIDKNSAQNLNIIRKFCLSVLKLVEIIHPKLSMKKKRFAIAHDTEKHLESVLNF